MGPNLLAVVMSLLGPIIQIDICPHGGEKYACKGSAEKKLRRGKIRKEKGQPAMKKVSSLGR